MSPRVNSILVDLNTETNLGRVCGKKAMWGDELTSGLVSLFLACGKVGATWSSSFGVAFEAALFLAFLALRAAQDDVFCCSRNSSDLCGYRDCVAAELPSRCALSLACSV